MIHKLYATKPIYPLDATITKDTKPLVERGAVAATIDTTLELDRAIAGLGNGSISLDPPAKTKAASVSNASPNAQ